MSIGGENYEKNLEVLGFRLLEEITLVDLKKILLE
jgi:hypothetical protein